MMRHAVGIGITLCNFVVARVGAYACGSKSVSLACIGMHWLVEKNAIQVCLPICLPNAESPEQSENL